jgi:hypothetical protein
MGSQQLLLIIIGVIVVGIVIYAGINIADNYYKSANREQLISTMHDLGIMAQQHYKKAYEQGGGGGSYSGWDIPQELRKTSAGEIKAVVQADRINFEATGTEIGMNGKTLIRVTCRVDQNGIRMIVTN